MLVHCFKQRSGFLLKDTDLRLGYKNAPLNDAMTDLGLQYRYSFLGACTKVIMTKCECSNASDYLEKHLRYLRHI